MGIVQAVGNDGAVGYVSDEDIKVNGASQDFDKIYKENTRTLEDIFQDVAKEYEVPIELLKAVAEAESGFDPNAVSSCGASGIMQLMPQTAKGLGVEDVFDPEQNITGGAKMLAYLLDDYDGDTTLALAAYNAGSGAVSKYGGVPPYEETRNYIKRINGILDGGLEKDLSYIQVGSSDNTSKNKGQDALAGHTSSTIKANIQGTLSATQSPRTSDELFSYDDYLRFVELYMKLMDSMILSDDEEENEVSEQQKFYEMQNSSYGLRLNSLFK